MRQLLRSVKAGLVALGNVLAIINTFFILTLVYVLLIGPIKLVFLLVRHDPLSRNFMSRESAWRPKEKVPMDGQSLSRQF